MYTESQRKKKKRKKSTEHPGAKQRDIGDVKKKNAKAGQCKGLKSRCKPNITSTEYMRFYLPTNANQT